MNTEYQYEWSLTFRIGHWLVVLAVSLLTFTGFYIHWPFLEGGVPGGIDLMAWMRFVHFVAAYVLIVALVVRVYLAFASTFHASWREFGLWRIIRGTPEMLAYYLFLRDTHKEYGRYNPLQALTYLLWLLLCLFMILTGFALYRGTVFGLLPAPDSFQWVNRLLGGESYTRVWHYLGMWAFLIMVVVHVYMAAMTSWTKRDRSLRSIITGYKLRPRRA